MKNILITTTFKEDTLQSIKLATEVMGNNASTITLLSCSEISDSITELLFLSSTDHADLQKRSDLLSKFQEYKNAQSLKATVQEHHQYGMSRPILEQILTRYQVDLVIVPLSFQQSKIHIHELLLKLLYKTSCPLMFLPERKQSREAIKRALYLNEPGRGLTPAVENLPFHIIHQSMLDEANRLSLEEMINKLRIDLVVKGKGRNESRQENETPISKLGVPVLTI